MQQLAAVAVDVAVVFFVVVAAVIQYSLEGGLVELDEPVGFVVEMHLLLKEVGVEEHVVVDSDGLLQVALLLWEQEQRQGCQVQIVLFFSSDLSKL